MGAGRTKWTAAVLPGAWRWWWQSRWREFGGGGGGSSRAAGGGRCYAAVRLVPHAPCLPTHPALPLRTCPSSAQVGVGQVIKGKPPEGRCCQQHAFSGLGGVGIVLLRLLLAASR